MNKSKALRVGGFVVAVAASAALIGAATGATGAYFTDSSPGNFNGQAGILHITTQNTYLNFTGLNPGVDQHQSVSYTLTSESTTPADIWLVFDTSTSAGATAYCDFTGAKDDSTCTGGLGEGGLGQYGHFKVQGPAGTFDSYNLALKTATQSSGNYSNSTSTNTCTVGTNGLGGSSVQHAVGGGNDIAQCGAPHAILLQQSLLNGHSGSATITFGLTGKWIWQNVPALKEPVPFKIVATQPGFSPIGTNW